MYRLDYCIWIFISFHISTKIVSYFIISFIRKFWSLWCHFDSGMDEVTCEEQDLFFMWSFKTADFWLTEHNGLPIGDSNHSRHSHSYLIQWSVSVRHHLSLTLSFTFIYFLAYFNLESLKKFFEENFSKLFYTMNSPKRSL